jgi:6-phosphogluconolactonase (cycloisomerase 2 family)
VSKLPNAAQLAVSHDGKTLYLASEVEQGVVQALRVGDNGELSELNQVASGGAGPVYLSLTPNGRICWWRTTSADRLPFCPSTQTAAWVTPRIHIRIRANRARRSRKLPSRAVCHQRS